MKIDEASMQSGLTKDIIRFYEKKGLINIARDNNGYRNFTLNDIYNIITIRQYNSSGVSLDQIKELFNDGEITATQTQLTNYVQQLEEERLWINLKMQSAIELNNLLADINSNISFRKLEHQNYYYYQKYEAPEYTSAYQYLVHHVSALRFAMRVTLNPTYTQDIGVLAKENVPTAAYEPIVYTNKTILRYYYKNVSNKLLDHNKITDILHELNLTEHDVTHCFTTQYFGNTSSFGSMIVCDFLLKEESAISGEH